MWQQVEGNRMRKNCSRFAVRSTGCMQGRCRLRRPQGDGYSFVPSKLLFAGSTLQRLWCRFLRRLDTSQRKPGAHEKSYVMDRVP